MTTALSRVLCISSDRSPRPCARVHQPNGAEALESSNRAVSSRLGGDRIENSTSGTSRGSLIGSGGGAGSGGGDGNRDGGADTGGRGGGGDGDGGGCGAQVNYSVEREGLTLGPSEATT